MATKKNNVLIIDDDVGLMQAMEIVLNNYDIGLSAYTEPLAAIQELKANKHDNSSRRGLFVLVGKRRGLLDYLARNNHEEYVALIKELGIRK